MFCFPSELSWLLEVQGYLKRVLSDPKERDQCIRRTDQSEESPLLAVVYLSRLPCKKCS